MAWSSDPDLRLLWLEPPPTTLRWEKVIDGLRRGGAELAEMSNLHLVVFWRGRVARFQHAAAGRMWRHQVRALRDFLDGPGAGLS